MTRSWRTRARGTGERVQSGTADGLSLRADVRPISSTDDYRRCQAVYRRCPDGRVRWV